MYHKPLTIHRLCRAFNLFSRVSIRSMFEDFRGQMAKGKQGIDDGTLEEVRARSWFSGPLAEVDQLRDVCTC